MMFMRKLGIVLFLIIIMVVMIEVVMFFFVYNYVSSLSVDTSNINNFIKTMTTKFINSAYLIILFTIFSVFIVGVLTILIDVIFRKATQ